MSDPEEQEPTPQDDERVILTSFLNRGLGLLIHPFLQRVLEHFHVQLHHLPPNMIAHLSGYVMLCEVFLGILLDWALFKHYFYAKTQTVSRDVYQMCGALGIQTKHNWSYFEMKWPDSLKGWTSTWFFYMEPLTPAGGVTLQLYLPAPAS